MQSKGIKEQGTKEDRLCCARLQAAERSNARLFSNKFRRNEGNGRTLTFVTKVEYQPAV